MGATILPRPPQLLPNTFLPQKSVFQKHLMERIINLFEYTSNLIRGPGHRGSRHDRAWHSPRDCAQGGGPGREGAVCGRPRAGAPVQPAKE